MKNRDSVKLKESVKNAKPEPMGHNQNRYYQSSHALLAINSLKLILASAAIKEHRITLEHIKIRDKDGLS